MNKYNIHNDGWEVSMVQYGASGLWKSVMSTAFLLFYLVLIRLGFVFWNACASQIGSDIFALERVVRLLFLEEKADDGEAVLEPKQL